MTRKISISRLETTNHILSSLPPKEFERIIPILEPVELSQATILFDADDTIEHIYFPNDGAMISVVTSSSSGQMAESGVIGSEGVGGLEFLLDGPESMNRHIIQLPGNGLRGNADLIKTEFERCSGFQKSVLAFARGLMVQMSQTALCNRMHVAEKRLAKWLLMCRDRAPTDVLPITQEFAALMLGSNRVSVTMAAGVLQDKNLIKYSRGRLTILDREQLEQFSCECYARIKMEFDKL